MSGPLQIGLWQLAVAAALLLVNVVLSVVLRLGLGRDLVVAAVRMVVQLALVGLVLDWVFSTRNPWIIVGIALAMAAIASVAAVRRTSRRFPGIYWESLVMVVGASFLVTGVAVVGVLQVRPWYEPQYLIPLHGMLLGNALTGISLGLDRFMEGCVEGRARIEMFLALGATRWEAARHDFRRAVRTGMIPSLNSMTIMGIVSLPGMMTGQILAGAAPGDAVRYQIMIMFMIASCVALATVGVVTFAFFALLRATRAPERASRSIALIRPRSRRWCERSGLEFQLPERIGDGGLEAEIPLREGVPESEHDRVQTEAADRIAPAAVARVPDDRMSLLRQMNRGSDASFRFPGSLRAGCSGFLSGASGNG